MAAATSATRLALNDRRGEGLTTAPTVYQPAASRAEEPALQATRLDLIRTMRGEVTRDSRPSRARNALIVAQVTATDRMTTMLR